MYLEMSLSGSQLWIGIVGLGGCAIGGFRFFGGRDGELHDVACAVAGTNIEPRMKVDFSSGEAGWTCTCSMIAPTLSPKPFHHKTLNLSTLNPARSGLYLAASA